MKTSNKEAFRKHLFGSPKITKKQLQEFNKIVMTCENCGPLKKMQTYFHKYRKYEYVRCRICHQNKAIINKKTRKKLDDFANYITQFLSMVEKE